MTVSQTYPPFKAALNTWNFATKPPVGGRPESDTMNMAIAAASPGLKEARPAKSSSCVLPPSRMFEMRTSTQKAPMFMKT